MFNNKLAKSYKECFSTVEGKKVLLDLMKQGRFMQPTFVPNDPYTSAYNEGMRRIILRIVSFVETDESLQTQIYNKTLKEEINNE